MNYLFTALLCITSLLTSCSSSDNGPDTQSIVGCMDSNAVNYNPNATESDESCVYTTPFTLEIPQLFLENILPPVIPVNNPLSIEGVALGRKLFYDPILSGDGTQACADCHRQENAFTDSLKFSVGIDGSIGTRNSMPLFNMAWNYDERFFWDGRVFSLEHQALAPVTNPIEMDNTWETVVLRLQEHEDYPELFKEAFGDIPISKELTTKAIAQFERTLISGNSKFDRFYNQQVEHHN